jgi:hypothetical protein
MKKNRVSKSLAGLAAGAMLILATSSAMGGEITGNGKSLQIAPHTLQGNSACAWSGRQDDPATAIEDNFKGVMAQSWGQITKAFREILAGVGAHPGTACNPSKQGG